MFNCYIVDMRISAKNKNAYSTAIHINSVSFKFPYCYYLPIPFECHIIQVSHIRALDNLLPPTIHIVIATNIFIIICRFVEL